MSAAPIQIVDEEDRPVGVASIDEAHKRGLIHRIARVMVEDEDGRVLLQMRSLDSWTHPGRWDNSAAGHVDAGETYEEAAKREAAEEIGLHDADLKEAGNYKQNTTIDWRKINRFNAVYKTVVSRDTKFHTDPEEVVKVKWFSLSDIKKMIADHPERVTDGLVDVIRRYYP